MLTTVAGMLLLVAAPEIPVRAGAEIVLDGKVDAAEWADAFSVTRDHPAGGKVRFLLKRNGSWLALGMAGEGPYRGEIMRVYVSASRGVWITSLILGVGQPAWPPALWRRSAPQAFANANLGPGDCPRACRVRVDVAGEKSWSAEYLVRLSALGIGRGDIREMSALFTMDLIFPNPKRVFVLPAGAEDPYDPSLYAKLVSADRWGATEEWAPVSAAVSREFDDHQLLRRLFLEHENISQREATPELVISSAVRPRSLTRINQLRTQLDAGKARNPTLPAWAYFRGRLLHEANMYAEAGKVIESIPTPLRSFDAFANLIAEHYHDTERFQKALDFCTKNPRMRNVVEVTKLSLQGRRVLAAEKEAIAGDAAKEDRNPRVRLMTRKGDIVCELFEDDAPLAVRNFISLIQRRKYYDNLRFHMVAGGQLVEVGDPRTRPGAPDDKDGPPWRLRADKSPRPFLRGYLATAPAPGGVFHGSQFVIALAPLLKDGEKVAVFGRVVEGLDVLESLEQDDRLVRVEIVSKRNHAYDPIGARYEH